MHWRSSGFISVARRLITVAMLIGLLSVPATCSATSGPHSLYLSPSGSPSSGGYEVEFTASVTEDSSVTDSAHALAHFGLHYEHLSHAFSPTVEDDAQGAPEEQGTRSATGGVPGPVELCPEQTARVNQIPHPAMTVLTLAADLPVETPVILNVSETPVLEPGDRLHGRAIAPNSPPPRTHSIS
ncbi:MAG TPA: hypothetical protein VIL01_01885 [Thermomicrobiales bacterium]